MIDCLKCGTPNPPANARCQACSAYLPVTTAANIEPRGSAPPRAEAGRPSWRSAAKRDVRPRRHLVYEDAFDEGEPDDRPDYRSAGGSTLIHDLSASPKAPGRSSRPTNDFPFELEPTIDVEDDDGIFTSAELLEDAFPADDRRVEYRSGQLMEMSGDEGDADLVRTDRVQPDLDEPYQDDLPLSPGARGPRRPEPPRAATAGPNPAPVGPRSRPPVMGPVTYVPGKGIVPISDSPQSPMLRPPPLPARSEGDDPLGPPGQAPGRTGPVSGRFSALARRVPFGSDGEGTVVDAQPVGVGSTDPGLGEVALLGNSFSDSPSGGGMAGVSSSGSHMAGSLSGSHGRPISSSSNVAPNPPTPPPQARPQPPPRTAIPPRPPAARSPLTDKLDAARSAFTGREPERAPAQAPPPSVAPTASLRLGILDAEGNVAETMPVSRGRAIIGRGEGDILLSRDAMVSTWHAQLRVGKDGVFIKDMKSRNGVYVRLREPLRLTDGADFIVGEQRFRFRTAWTEVDPDRTGEFGARGIDAMARLILLREGGDPCGVYFLGDRLTIGRARGDVVFGEDGGMAPEHAAIQRSADGHVLLDLGSATGTFARIEGEARLLDGDCVQIGRTRLKLMVA